MAGETEPLCSRRWVGLTITLGPVSDAAPQVTYLAFAFADVFPADDALSEWLTTLALAMNDIALVHVRLDEDQDSPEKAFYWNRLAVSHFTEIGRFLNDTREIPEVKAFVDSLPVEVRAQYESCIGVWHELRARLFRTRNLATFHYPDLRTTAGADRPMRDALEAVSADRGVVRAGRIRDARALFADDLVASIFGNAVGGLNQIEAFEAHVVAGTTGLIRFTNLALDEHLTRARASGVVLEEVEPVDPGDLRVGWKVVRTR